MASDLTADDVRRIVREEQDRFVDRVVAVLDMMEAMRASQVVLLPEAMRRIRAAVVAVKEGR